MNIIKRIYNKLFNEETNELFVEFKEENLIEFVKKLSYDREIYKDIYIEGLIENSKRELLMDIEKHITINELNNIDKPEIVQLEFKLIIKDILS